LIELSTKISDYLRELFDEEYAKKYTDYTKTDFVTYLRFPSREKNHDAIINSLKRYGIKLEAVENIPYAYRVVEGYDKVGKTVEHTLGRYYIQSLSSMIPPFVLNPNKEDVTLDLCAAPGSKTTQLAELMNNRGTLVANEPSNKRIRSLVFNADRLNLVNLGVIRYKGESLSKVYDHHFDKILVDAPCSGLGIVQKKGEISNWWNTEQVRILSELQLRLLISAIKMAKVGAEILYSTCTITFEENEYVIDKVLGKYPVELETIELPVPSHEGLTECYGDEFSPELKKTRRILPWEINSEGFFIAKLRKTGPTDIPSKEVLKKDDIRFIPAGNKFVKKYIHDLSEYYGIEYSVLDEFQYRIKTHDVYFINKEWSMNALGIYERLGIKFGKVDKNDYIVLHTHAARVFGNRITKNVIDLSSEELNIYMQGGTVKKECDLLGQKVVRYEGNVIGTAVATQSGLKSQFPRSLRTQEIILPDDLKQ
jgi:16S rRNA (cytosine1407-C5)-methyltransferase